MTPPKPADKSHWYDADWLLPYHLVVVAVGFLLVVAGMCLIRPWAGLLTCGAGLMVAGYLMAKAW